MRDRLFSAALVLFIGISSSVLFWISLLIWLVTRWFDRRLVLLHYFACFWASLYTWFSPFWKLDVQGRENLSSGQPCVVVVNHLSHLDILIMFRLFFHFKFVAKSELFKVPFIGWNMRLNKYIPVVRGSKESAMKMLDRCEESLANGSSVLFFPEGTRSRDGRMRSFKHGAFVLAQRAKVPILPVVLHGTDKALPSGEYHSIGKHTIRMRILKPVLPESFQNLDTENMIEMIRSTMKSVYENLPSSN